MTGLADYQQNSAQTGTNSAKVGIESCASNSRTYRAHQCLGNERTMNIMKGNQKKMKGTLRTQRNMEAKTEGIKRKGAGKWKEDESNEREMKEMKGSERRNTV